MNPSDLARQAGVSRGIIYKLERGRGKSRHKTLARIAAALGMSVENLLAPGNQLKEPRSVWNVGKPQKWLSLNDLIEQFSHVTGITREDVIKWVMNKMREHEKEEDKK